MNPSSFPQREQNCAPSRLFDWQLLHFIPASSLGPHCSSYRDRAAGVVMASDRLGEGHDMKHFRTHRMYTVTTSICQRKSDRSEDMAIPPPFVRKVHMSGTHSGATPSTSGVALYQVAIKSAPRRRRGAPPAERVPGRRGTRLRVAVRRGERRGDNKAGYPWAREHTGGNEGDLV